MPGQTEILLYRTNVVTDPTFKLTDAWTITNTTPPYGWTIVGDGYARFETGSATESLIFQDDVLKIGVTYLIRMKLTTFDANAVTVYCGTNSYLIPSNGWVEFELACDGNTTFGIGAVQALVPHLYYGFISNVSVIEYPTVVGLDVDSNISIPLTFNVADIREPEKRNANFSKTVTIPGTKNNNTVFHEIFEIGIDGLFNPNKRTDAIILQDSIEVFKGIIQLKNIKRDYPKGAVSYEVVFFGKVANIFFDIGSDKLTDLDLSEFDHTYSKANQKLSWDTSIIKDGSTYVNFSGGAPTGEGYVYPYIDYATAVNVNTWNVNDFRPAVYVKTYVDKIFKAAGFNYNSNFFNSDFFQRLIVPHNGEKLTLTAAQIEARRFRASVSATQSYQATNFLYSGFGTTFPPVIAKTPFNNDSTGVNFDTGNCYNTVTYEYTVPANGIYTFQTDHYINITATNNSLMSDSINWVTDPRVDVYMKKRAVGTGIITTLNATTHTFDIAALPAGFNIPFGGTWNSGNATILVQANSISLTAGDVIYCEVLWAQDDFAFPSGYYEFFTEDSTGNPVTVAEAPPSMQIVSGTTIYNQVSNSTILDGQLMTMNTAIPESITQKDFLVSLINMFNLYIETDKDNEKMLLIEPRDDYYAQGSVVDWTRKLDTSQPLDLAPMGDLQARNYLYTYKSDSDYLNKKYSDSYNKEVYGQNEVVVNNDYVTSTNKTEIIFSPTPLEIQAPTSNDRVIPRIYAYDAGTGVTKATKSNIRILYYLGRKATAYTWSYTSTVSGTSMETDYPYAGHLDDVDAPTIDLSFGFPKELYYVATVYTPNTLYNTYYRRFLEEITDKDSKIVTGYFNLKPSDIYALDFRNEFYIDGYYLRLNKISDFNVNDTKPVKCEFIKVVSKQPWEAKDFFEISKPGFMFGEAWPVGGGVLTPAAGSGVVLSTTSVVRGELNYVDGTARNVLITGDNNRVMTGAINVSIIGSNNVTIGPGVTNVQVINSDDQLVTESNTVIINGVQITQNGAVILPINLVDAGQDISLSNFPTSKLIDVVDAGEDVTRPRGTRSIEQIISAGEDAKLQNLDF